MTSLLSRLAHLLLWGIMGGLLLPVLQPRDAVAEYRVEPVPVDFSAPISEGWTPPGVHLELAPWVGTVHTMPSPLLLDALSLDLAPARTGAGGGGENRGLWPADHHGEDRKQWFATWGGAGIGLVLSTAVAGGVFWSLQDVDANGLVLALAALPYFFLPATFASLFNRAPWKVNFVGGAVGAGMLVAGTFVGVVVGVVLLVFSLFVALGRLLAGESNAWMDSTLPWLFFGPMIAGAGLGYLATSLGPSVAFGIWARKNPRNGVATEAKVGPMLGVLPRDRRRGTPVEAVGGLQLALSF